MRVKLTSSGGFGGLEIVDEVQQAPTEAVKLLETLVPQLQALSKQDAPAGASSFADGMEYEIEIERDGQLTRYTLQEGQAPHELLESLDALKESIQNANDT